jgi:hypothetical protein
VGLFGNPFKAITRAVGLPDTTYKVANLVAPIIPLTGKLTDAAIGATLKLTQSKAPTPAVQQMHVVGADPGPLPGNNIQPTSPSYVYYSGGGYAPSSFDYAPQQYGGPSSWDYSTGYQTYSTPQYQTLPTYSAPATSSNRTWEDLVSLAPLFL